MEYLTLEQKRKKTSKQVFFWTALAVVVLLGGWATVKLAQSSKEQIVQRNTQISTIKEGDWIRGDVNAPVTMVEYSDFQCPACRKVEPNIQQVLSEYGTKVKFVYRHFPLIQIHQTAVLSASAAEAAGKQGKFWEMHDLLFLNQDVWAEKADAKQTMAAFAQSLGLNMEQFEKDLTSEITASKVTAGYNEAIRLGLDHTPTLFVDGQEAADTSVEGLKRLIEDKLND